ncbi:MAG: response regulator [Spirochaetales bacterium]|nr:response regulator [Spirochaetales bacterium]
MARILIVDDDQDLREGQQAFLQSKGFEVETAGGMEEGLARLTGVKPDLILADLMMEHYDSGFVFCKKVRDIPGLEDIPILLQTAAPKEIGFTLDSYNTRAREWMKVDEVLIKPVPLEDLVGKIRQYLSR